MAGSEGAGVPARGPRERCILFCFSTGKCHSPRLTMDLPVWLLSDDS